MAAVFVFFLLGLWLCMNLLAHRCFSLQYEVRGTYVFGELRIVLGLS